MAGFEIHVRRLLALLFLSLLPQRCSVTLKVDKETDRFWCMTVYVGRGRD